MTKGKQSAGFNPIKALDKKGTENCPLYIRGGLWPGELLFEGAYNRNTKSASKQATYSWRELISQGLKVGYFLCLQVDGPITGGGGFIRGIKVMLHETIRNDDF